MALLDHFDPLVSFNFENGILTRITLSLSTDAVHTFDAYVEQLTAKYGAPKLDNIVHKQNAYGAQWDDGQAIWTMSDGGTIAALEEHFPN